MNRLIRSSLILPCIFIQLNGNVIKLDSIRIDRIEIIDNKKDENIKDILFKDIEEKGFDDSFITALKEKYSDIDFNKLSKIIDKFHNKKEEILNSIKNDMINRRKICFKNNAYILGLLQRSGIYNIKYSDIIDV